MYCNKSNIFSFLSFRWCIYNSISFCIRIILFLSSIFIFHFDIKSSFAILISLHLNLGAPSDSRYFKNIKIYRKSSKYVEKFEIFQVCENFQRYPCPGKATLVAWDKEVANPPWMKDTVGKDHHPRLFSKKSTSPVRFAIDNPSIFQTRTYEKMSNATNQIVAWYARTMPCSASCISIDVPLKSFSQRNLEKFKNPNHRKLIYLKSFVWSQHHDNRLIFAIIYKEKEFR